jgi:tetratricopeptide (TPR) repeat protein
VNVDNLVQRAEAEAGRRNYDGAIEYFLQALALDPAHRGARRGARSAALKKYEHGYPPGYVRALTGFGPRLGLALVSLGKDRRRRMEALEKVLAKDPRNPALGMRLGAEAEAASLPSAAAAAYEGVVLGNPEHLEALKALARVLHAMGAIDEAREVVEKAVQAAPRDAEVQRLRKDVAADGYARDAGFAGAKTTHDLLRDKDQARKLEGAQKIVRGQDDLAEQARSAREEAGKRASDPVAWAALGAAEAAVRDYDAAEAAYGKAIALSPGDTSLRVKVGDVRIAREERAAAELRQKAAAGDAAAKASLPAAEKRLLATLVTEYRARVASHPTDLGLRHALAGHLERAGEVEAAIAEYQHSVKDPRRRADSLGGLGRCFLARGMFDLAAKQIEKALDEEGAAGGERSKALLYDLATVHEKQGDLKRAGECLARIYETDIAYRDAAQRLERIRKAAG